MFFVSGVDLRVYGDQFMLYTPMPGTALHTRIAAEGRLVPDLDIADSPGQFKFNFRHAAISRDDSKAWLDPRAADVHRAKGRGRGLR